MKSWITAALLLALATPTWAAKPLVVADNAWRASALNEIAPLLRACLNRPDPNALPRLPLAPANHGALDENVLLQEPATLGRGHWYRIGWRAKDGLVFIVAARSPDGQRTVFGPVTGGWTCLPAEIRKELK
jgi:hypothetical protein